MLLIVDDLDSTNLDSTNLASTLHALPKIELHRHLEGSWRLETLSAIAREYCLPIPAYDLEAMRPNVQIMPDEARNPTQFLSKFRFLRQFFRSQTIIQRVTHEAIQDAAADNIRSLELRFTPQAVNNLMHCEYGDVVGWVCDAAQLASVQNAIQVRLIISMNRHEPVKIGEAVLEAALAHRDRGVVGIDLAGQEAGFSAQPFSAIFQRAKAEGLGVTVHAGEWAGAESIREALDDLGADRLGHGIRAGEDAAILADLIQRGIVLEVCPTSNVHSGASASLEVHPLYTLMRAGVLTTLNTDDPLISAITLTDQLQQALDAMPLTLADLKQQQITAANALYLPEPNRAALVSEIDQAWGTR